MIFRFFVCFSVLYVCMTTVVRAAVTQCVGLNDSVTCTGAHRNTNADKYGNDPKWSATCKINGKNVELLGNAFCSNKSGAENSITTSLTQSTNSMENINCWCRIDTPGISSWVAVDVSGLISSNAIKPASCDAVCPVQCAAAIQNTPEFRRAIFSTITGK